MNGQTLTGLLQRIGAVRVCVIGDVCLDIYWRADMTKSRLSRETPHFPLPVTEERYSPGGGGNVMANAAALGVKEMRPVSVLGRDWRGMLARECLAAMRADTAGIVTDGARVTPCYAKPLRAGLSDVVYEDPRLDFENDAPLSETTETAVLAALEAAAKNADVIAVSDQLDCGVVTPRVRARLCALGSEKPVIVDSRSRIALYKNVIVKPNALEAAAALGAELPPAESARALSEKTGAPCIVTLGERGCVWYENGGAAFVPAVKTEPPVDTVGAGDAFLAAFAAAYGAGAAGTDAAAFAALAAAVTVKKIGTTGTATPEEITALFFSREGAQNA